MPVYKVVKAVPVMVLDGDVPKEPRNSKSTLKIIRKMTIEEDVSNDNTWIFLDNLFFFNSVYMGSSNE